MTTLLITIVPSMLILLYFFLSDRFKEPKGTIALVFFLGVLICLPAGIINDFMYENFNDGSDLSEKLYSSFLAPAWGEELLKFIILYFVVLRRNEFNEPMDGIVYGVTVSLGFATYENYDYVFRLAELWEIDPYQMAIWRSYSAIPLHGLNGCIMGFYFGMYSFTANKKYLILCLLIPYLIHGFYNFLDYPYHFIVVGMLTIYAIALHSHFKKLQSKKLKEVEIKKI
jgi:RsiW-degrading membrane proteinase PrsW (M82 family)